MMMVMIILKTLVPTYLVQIICPGITLTITPIKKSTNSVLFGRLPFLLHYAAGSCWFQVRGGVRFLGERFLVKDLFCRPFSWRKLFGERLVL